MLARGFAQGMVNYMVKGGGDPVIFVHGLGENLESWSEQVDKVSAQGFTGVSLDLRGHGKSDSGEGRIEMEGFADDVLGVLKSISAERAHFCGLSMGALVLLEAYKRSPGAFRSMVLVSTLPQYPPAQTQALENMSMAEVGEQVAGAAVSPAAPMELKKKIAKVIASTSKRVYIESAETACTQDYTPMLQGISVPVLLVAGDLDFITPPEAAKFMQKRIPNSQLAVIRGVGHLPNREDPAEFDRVLLGFLKGVA